MGLSMPCFRKGLARHGKSDKLLSVSRGRPPALSHFFLRNMAQHTRYTDGEKSDRALVRFTREDLLWRGRLAGIEVPVPVGDKLVGPTSEARLSTAVCTGSGRWGPTTRASPPMLLPPSPAWARVRTAHLWWGRAIPVARLRRPPRALHESSQQATG